MSRLQPSDAIWLVAYVLVMSCVVGLMFTARGCARDVYGTTQARVDWQRWREVAKEQSDGKHGPVQRRERNSAEPPALVLMREHFTACLGLAIVLSSALFFTLMITFRGVWRQRERPGGDDPDSGKEV